MLIRIIVLAGSLLLLAAGIAYAKPTESADTGAAGIGREPLAEAGGTLSPHARLTQFLLQPVADPNQLQGRRVAILAADGVDGFDLEVPRSFLAERGATVHVIVPRSPQVIQASGSGAVVKPKTEIGVLEPSGERDTAPFDRYVDQVDPADYDAVYVPGNLDALGGLNDAGSVAFLQQAVRAGKAIFAAGNFPLLLKAGLLDDGPGSAEAAAALRVGSRGDAPFANTAVVYTSRDAFDMPDLMGMLVATLLARPAAQP